MSKIPLQEFRMLSKLPASVVLFLFERYPKFLSIEDQQLHVDPEIISQLSKHEACDPNSELGEDDFIKPSDLLVECAARAIREELTSIYTEAIGNDKDQD